ncbi:MAG: hypothetical protein K6G06_05405 [Butyrivibrio sp.]|nr:hypothetical protein [Butyrivibrio sp.]
MKKVIVKKLLTMATALCLSVTSAYAFAPAASIKALAVGDYSNPTTIQPNSDYSSSWIDIKFSHAQCYKVTLPSDGRLSVTVMAKNTENLPFAISSSPSLSNLEVLKGTDVGNYTKDSPVSETISTVLSAGTYYIPLEHRLGQDTAQYKIKTVYESFGFSDTADSFDSPKTLAIGGTYTNAITATDKEDWYKVTVPENGKYTFRYSTVHNTVQFKLKNIDLREVCGKDCSLTTPSKTEDAFLEAGTYYLHVYGWPSKYSFSMTSSTTSQPSISKAKAVRNRKVDITFKNVQGAAGYQIRYSTDKNFNKNVKVKTFKASKARTVGGNKKVYTISKLKKNKRYYVQIRSYEEKNNAKFYSGWSKAKKVKVK